MQVETRYAKSGDAHIAYQIMGDGEIDIAFVPCWMSHLDRYLREPRFVRFIERMSLFGRLILFDKRGTGLSDPVSSSASPTLEDRMDDLTAVLDAVGSSKAVLFGMAIGGKLSALFSATYPERVAGLILMESSARGAWACDYPFAPTWDVWEQRFDHLNQNWGGPVWIESYAASLKTDIQFAAWWAECLRSAGGPAAAVAMERLDAESDIRSALPSIKAPALVLHRRGDQVVKVEEGRYLAEHIPGARLVELDGEDHLPFVGDQDVLFREIGRFLTSQLDSIPLKQALSTVVAVEIDGVEEARKRLGEEHWTLTRKLVRSEIRALQEAYRGLVGMPLGEGFVAAFDGPSRAIRFAREVAGILADQGMRARIGLHSGPIAYSDKHLGGVATELASRIAGLADADEILLTGTLMGLVSGSGLNFAPIDDRELTGLPAGLRLAQVADSVSSTPTTRTAVEPYAPSVDELSPREREVAYSVARGISNREVATELGISVSTVERHMANILLKLGFRSRSQLSAWAAGQQLEPVQAAASNKSYAAD